ncbi:MAG: hypothetical protein K6V73_08395 [Firmicutes bacterium]|nr:hypothetical protein [Bacillota bacterium]
MNVRRVVPAAAAAALLALGYGAMGAVATAAGPAAHRAATHRATVYTVRAKIETGAMDHRDGPAMVPGSVRLPAHALVRMIIVSYDDGPAPAPGHTAIQGVVGGRILVDGRAVTKVAPSTIAHTFTVPALGLNVPIPAAPKGGSVTVAFTFHTGRAGTYAWQCYAECGDGPTGWGYPMTTEDMMRGNVVVR